MDICLGICMENSVTAMIGDVDLMATSAQQSSPTTPLPMLVKKQTSSPSTMRYPLLFVASRNHILVIGGNMNAQIGKNVNKKFSLQNLSNKWGTSNRFHTRK